MGEVIPAVISERMVEQAGSLAPLLWWVVDAFEGAKRGLPEMAEDIEKVRKEVEDTLKNLNVRRPTLRLEYGGRSMGVGTSYKNSISGEVEEVGRRHPWENLGMCTRCRGFVEPPDDPGGVYTCCGCGLKFVVEE